MEKPFAWYLITSVRNELFVYFGTVGELTKFCYSDPGENLGAERNFTFLKHLYPFIETGGSILQWIRTFLDQP